MPSAARSWGRWRRSRRRPKSGAAAPDRPLRATLRPRPGLRHNLPWAGLAQLVEQRFCKAKVAGSNPATGTRQPAQVLLTQRVSANAGRPRRPHRWSATGRRPCSRRRTACPEADFYRPVSTRSWVNLRTATPWSKLPATERGSEPLRRQRSISVRKLPSRAAGAPSLGRPPFARRWAWASKAPWNGCFWSFSAAAWAH